jgi:hypothetical protein
MATSEHSREMQRARFRKWKAANPERAAEIQRSYAANHPEKVAYTRQRLQARKRGIEWLFTFDEWWAVWEASGKWKQRGTHKGQYGMSRFGDKGPYAATNVRICIMEENVSEAHKGSTRSEEHRRRIGVANAKAVQAYWDHTPRTTELLERLTRARKIRWGQTK